MITKIYTCMFIVPIYSEIAGYHVTMVTTLTWYNSLRVKNWTYDAILKYLAINILKLEYDTLVFSTNSENLE